MLHYKNRVMLHYKNRVIQNTKQLHYKNRVMLHYKNRVLSNAKQLHYKNRVMQNYIFTTTSLILSFCLALQKKKRKKKERHWRVWCVDHQPSAEITSAKINSHDNINKKTHIFSLLFDLLTWASDVLILLSKPGITTLDRAHIGGSSHEKNPQLLCCILTKNETYI